jgi:hypothetical protein
MKDGFCNLSKKCVMHSLLIMESKLFFTILGHDNFKGNDIQDKNKFKKLKNVMDFIMV